MFRNLVLLTCVGFAMVFMMSIPSNALSAGSSTGNATRDAVTAVLNRQAEAWNKGDLDAFMTAYLKSPDICYTSSGKEYIGYDALQQRYVSRYGNSRDTMGKLRFSDLRVSELGKEHSLAIGHWHLERAGQADLDGIFSLVLVHTKDGWKIIHDHTSTL